MKAASLRDEIIAGCVELAWDQWSQLGVSGAAPERSEQRSADPEALLLFTLEIGRQDPRLFDETLDWLSVNHGLVSVQRLRNLCVDAVDKALVDAALAWSTGNRTSGARANLNSPAQLLPLFAGVPSPGADVDDVFARYGFERAPLRLSGKSLTPRLQDPISFALRLRRLLGVGVRAEVVRLLLTIRAPRVSGRVIAASAAYAQRNVREGLTHLVEAGIVDAIEVSADRQYSVHPVEWAALLRLPAVRDVPLYFDWITTLRALTAITRWLQQPALDDLSDYMLASQARTLVEQHVNDLSHAGVPLQLYSTLGPGFWDDFVEISRLVLRNATRV